MSEVNVSAPFIRRPVMTTLVMLTILMFGIVAYRELPVNDLPTIDYPTISVSASLPGASPETMASAVATPLEQQFTSIAGIDNLSSTSSLGSTSITLQFSLSRDIDAAAADVQSAISKTLRSLPQGIQPPTFNRSNPADAPVMVVALTSDQMKPSALNEYAETFLAQRLSMLEGVAQVNVFGQQKYAVRIQLDPQRLATQGLGIDEVANAVSSGNVNLPSGVLMGPRQQFTVEANGQLQNAAAFRELIVAYRNGTPVRLGDVGRVIDDVQNNRVASWINGRRNIALAIQRQPGANTVAVADRVNKKLAELATQIPASIKLETVYDRSQSIRESVHDVQFTLLLTLCLVVLVIFLFLRNLSATVIPSLALPFSIVGTFAVMYALDYSLDNLSLMALTLAVGFVVDDAIVMLENIVRHLEMGKNPMQAALDGSREIGFTIVSMTLSLVAVFIPIMFMPGLVGRLFREFAVTIGVAILVSGFVSLTLTPLLCSRWLKPGRVIHHEGQPATGFWGVIERLNAGALRLYLRTLDWVMARRPLTLVASVLTLAATAWLFITIPKGFLPSEDIGRLEGTTEVAEGTGFDELVRRQRLTGEIVAKHPAVDRVLSAVGPGGRTSAGANQGRLTIRLKPRNERVGVEVVMRDLTRQVQAQVPGMQVFMRNPPPISIGGRQSKSMYQITLQASDIAQLYTAARAFEGKLRELPEVEGVTSDLAVGNPQVSVDIDRERAASLGVSAQQIESALYDAYGSRQVSTILTPTDQFWVVMELLPEAQRDIAALSMLHVRSRTGELVPLGSVARFEKGVGPLTVSHAGQLPSVTVSFNPRSGVALGTAVDAVSNLARVELPASVSTTFSGDTQAFQQAQSGLLILLLLAVFVIYVVLGILYESFIHPITILSGLPFAALGALATLRIFGVDLSVYAYVGIIMLIGLVKKNAIMMIDFALEAERKEGKSPQAAILEACAVRFRPIMMTTMAALFGTLPIAVGYGAGAESRQPLGLAVVGGLAFSQLITLYVTPVVYTYLDELRGWVGARKGRRAPVLADPLAVAGD
jgi:hydrophobic/amphiphilic exporter-1 (mainly G- bacteria), HAE1 family